MATKVGDAQNIGDVLERGTRNVVRTSGGDLYIVAIDTVASPEAIAVWKYSGSWAEQDAANRPADGSGDIEGVSVAIDSSDKIHIFWYGSGDASFVYTTFDTSGDQWNGGDAASTEEVAAEVDGPQNKLYKLLVSITVDSADKPHVAWQDSDALHGTDYDTMWYANKVGANWSTALEVEGFNAQKDCRSPEITVNDSDIPLIVYINETDSDVTAAKGDQNDASAFTLVDVDSTVSTTYPSIAVDSDGNAWIAYEDSDDTIDIAKQSADWTSGWTIVSDGDTGKYVNLGINGTDVYVFYEELTTTWNMVYNKYDGSWDGETALTSGTHYHYAKARWSLNNNVSYATYGIDYVFGDGTDLYYDNLSIGAAPAAYKQKVIFI